MCDMVIEDQDLMENDSNETQKFWALVHPGGPRGIVHKEPKMQEQDQFALPTEGYAVAFFPKIDCLGPAMLSWPRVEQTFSQTPEAAIAKFMDGIVKGEKWETYQEAGHRVRRLCVTDLGDAE